MKFNYKTNTIQLETDGYITIDKHSSSPATPPLGSSVLYVKADGNVYSKNDAGSESSAIEINIRMRGNDNEIQL